MGNISHKAMRRENVKDHHNQCNYLMIVLVLPSDRMLKGSSKYARDEIDKDCHDNKR